MHELSLEGNKLATPVLDLRALSGLRSLQLYGNPLEFIPELSPCTVRARCPGWGCAHGVLAPTDHQRLCASLSVRPYLLCALFLVSRAGTCTGSREGVGLVWCTEPPQISKPSSGASADACAAWLKACRLARQPSETLTALCAFAFAQVKDRVDCASRGTTPQLALIHGPSSAQPLTASPHKLPSMRTPHMPKHLPHTLSVSTSHLLPHQLLHF